MMKNPTVIPRGSGESMWTDTMYRHCGLDPQSRGVTVILDLIQNPQGRETPDSHSRESGNPHNDATHRHSGLDPESTGRGNARSSFPAEAGIYGKRNLQD